MKKRLIVTLLCVNAALIVVLAFVTGLPSAQAQIVGGGTDYLLMTGHISSSYDAIYVIELNSQRIAAFKMDRTTKKIALMGARVLTKDFRKAE